MRSKKVPYPTYLFFIAFTLFGHQISFGQSILDKYIEEGIKSNQRFLQAQIESNISVQENKIAKGQLYPDVFFSADYSISNGGRSISIPLGDLLNPIHSSLNDINGNNQFPNDLENVDEQFLPNDFHDTKVRIVQPLLNTDIYYQYKASQANISATKAREESYKAQLKFEITRAYYDYLKNLEQKKILDSTQILLKELARVNLKFVKYHIATRDIIYNSESQLFDVDAQIAAAEREVSTSKMYFNTLLNRNLNDAILVDSEMTTNFMLTGDLEQQALDNRSEIKAVQSSIDSLQYHLKKDQSYLIPNINVIGDFGYQGYGYHFDGEQEYYMVNLRLTWPIFKGNRNRAEIKKTQFYKNQVELQLQDLKNSIKLQVNSALLQFAESQKVYEAQLAGLKSADENFKIVRSRYRENLVPLVEFNEARINYTNTRLKVSIAKYNIKIAEANLKRTLQL